jgi:hypothetical protein
VTVLPNYGLKLTSRLAALARVQPPHQYLWQGQRVQGAGPQLTVNRDVSWQ